MPNGFYTMAAVIAFALVPTLWGLRHRPAIRRRLRGLSERDRARVYLALSLNALQFEPYDEWELADWVLRSLAEGDGGPSEKTSGFDARQEGC